MLTPQIRNVEQRANTIKICNKCARPLTLENFASSHSVFCADGFLPTCNDCIEKIIEEGDSKWELVNKICQTADIPWIPKEWERLKENNGNHTWRFYSRIFAKQEYDGIGWDYYDSQFRKLKEVGLIEDEIPLVYEEKMKKLRRIWGDNYDDDALYYLEDLYQGLLVSQNVNGALQEDQARKLCKISYVIDSFIREGNKDIDKFLGSYDKLVKTAEFTPKNTKNATDFDSVAELIYWLEKRGWVNKYYDDTTRDVIDETLKNIQNYNQKLYLTEGGMGEEISERLNALKESAKLEQVYDTQQSFDLQDYDNEGYIVEDEDFDPDGGDTIE